MQPRGFAPTPSWSMLAGAGLASAAFAYATYSPLRALLPTAFLGAVGSGIGGLVGLSELGTTWATAVAAVAIGALSYAVATRVRVPPLALLVPALIPLLPGMVLYQGLVNLTLGESGAPLVTAAATAIALASGAILGQYLVQPVRRTNRRLESRLAGPRLVGPMRLAARPDRGGQSMRSMTSGRGCGASVPISTPPSSTARARANRWSSSVWSVIRA
jgi:uncharacterized membrane protein YjjB (DUF3815 family)